MIWDWYIGLFSNTNDAVKIGAWAATLTTIGLLSSFLAFTLRFLKHRFAKVKVEAGISHQIISSAFATGRGSPLLTVTVTNKTGSVIFIQNPSLVTSRKINGNNRFVVPANSKDFPVKLENGGQFRKEYDTAWLHPQILAHLSASDKVGFKVHTTLDKSYSSNRFSKEFIEGHILITQRP